MADVVVVVARLWRGEGGGGGTSSADSLSTARPREGREERALPSGGGGRRRRESSSGRWYYYYNSKGEGGGGGGGGGGGPRPAQHPRHPPLTSAEDRERDRGKTSAAVLRPYRGGPTVGLPLYIHSVFPSSSTDPMAVWRGGGGDDEDRVWRQFGRGTATSEEVYSKKKGGKKFCFPRYSRLVSDIEGRLCLVCTGTLDS